MVLLSNKCVWKTRNPHPSRLPDGSILPQTDSGHFAGASLGSYPATISHTTRVLRHVLANALCYIASLINNRSAKSLLTSFRQSWCEAPVEGFYTPKYGSPVRGAQHRSAGEIYLYQTNASGRREILTPIPDYNITIRSFIS